MFFWTSSSIASMSTPADVRAAAADSLKENDSYGKHIETWLYELSVPACQLTDDELPKKPPLVDERRLSAALIAARKTLYNEALQLWIVRYDEW